MRFLHTADWQIGMTRHYLDAEAQARFGAARIDAIRRIGAVGPHAHVTHRGRALGALRCVSLGGQSDISGVFC